ncbi:TPA: hypothetical protein DEP96_01920 [Candidatus Uhrbacteria bacterium]|nr:hypothetical protein [Candidatus Uhrbacteria bacterium]
MAKYVKITERDLASIVRSSSFGSSRERGLAEFALDIVLKDRRSGGKVDISYFEEAMDDLSRNLLSGGAANRVIAKIEALYDEQQKELAA